MAVAAPEQRAKHEDAAATRTSVSPHLIFLPIALMATLALQFTTLNHYFYFDDYVPFAEIVTQSRWEYISNLVTSTDLTPNWRPLPGLLFLANYEIAGMDPLPARIVMVAMHVGTAAMLYYVVQRTTRQAWAACVAALVFGLNPAYVGALSQVTTATQIMAGFFLVATLIAVIECALSDDRRRSLMWLGASAVLYILAIASHEGMAIMFPAYGLAFLTFDANSRGRLRRSALRIAPLALVAFATAISFTACGCNEGTDVWGTSYVAEQTLIYLGRLLYPVGLELPNDVGLAHAVAAPVLIVVMAVVSFGGPKVGRVGALWVVLAVAPHVFIEYFTASRYLYLATPGYALVFAAAAMMVVERLPTAVDRRAVAAVGGAAVVLLAGWYAYQTYEQDEHFRDASTAWRGYHDDVTALWPDVPPDTRVITIGGPFQKYEYQLYILPAFAETTWGPTRILQDYEPGSLPAQLALTSDSPYVAVYQDGVLTPINHGDR